MSIDQGNADAKSAYEQCLADDRSFWKTAWTRATAGAKEWLTAQAQQVFTSEVRRMAVAGAMEGIKWAAGLVFA
jgi:hypothetical protein